MDGKNDLIKVVLDFGLRRNGLIAEKNNIDKGKRFLLFTRIYQYFVDICVGI